MASRLVQIAHFTSAPAAELAKNLLEEATIPAFLEDVHTALVHPVTSIKLSVPEDCAGRAWQILQACGSFAVDESRLDGEYCLACGAEMAEADESCPQCGWNWEKRPE